MSSNFSLTLKSLDITIEECEFSHLGSIGIFLKNTSKFLVQNNVFFDIGYHGILTMYKDEIKDTMEDIMIRNNLFDGCGISRYWQPASVLVMGSYNVTVTNNGGFPEMTSYFDAM